MSLIKLDGHKTKPYVMNLVKKKIGLVERWGIDRDERKIRIKESEYIEPTYKIFK